MYTINSPTSRTGMPVALCSRAGKKERMPIQPVLYTSIDFFQIHTSSDLHYGSQVKCNQYRISENEGCEIQSLWSRCDHHVYNALSHTHTQVCKHRQTGSSHCSSFVYTLTFSQHLSYMFCTRLANGGLFTTGDPIVPFVISPRFECLNKLTHTPTHTLSSSIA